MSELHIDRAYLTSHWVKQRSSDLTIICKAWRVRHGQHFDKTAFVLDWKNHLIRCPNGVSLPFSEGQVVHFPKGECDVCPLHSQCTTSSTGPSVSIHPDESLLQELRQPQMTPAGRAQLRSWGGCGTLSGSHSAMARRTSSLPGSAQESFRPAANACDP